MGFIARDSGGGSDFEPVPFGTHIARCVTVADMGIQQSVYGGKEKAYLGFEVPGIRVEWEKDGQQHSGPAFIGSRYTVSLHEKSILGQHLTSWRGVPFTDEERQGFDLFSVLGAPCMISVVHAQKGEKVYANIQSIMRLPQGTQCPPAESELIAYTPMDNDKAINIDKLPPWLQKLCREGHKIAEGSHVIGSAGGPMPAPGQPAPIVPPPVEQQLTPPASTQPPQTAAEAMDRAMQEQTPDFDDDLSGVPF